MGTISQVMADRTDSGLRLLLDRVWGQEVVHQLVLQVLLQETALAEALGIWAWPGRPSVRYEPFRGLFDLALEDGDHRVLVELKVSTDLGEHQRTRQREKAMADGSPRVYVLLGPAYFAAADEPDARNIGVPELTKALRAVADQTEGATADLARNYLWRLEVDRRAWEAPHDVSSDAGLDLFRLYAELARPWPVDVQPTKVTHPGGPDWILDADAWTRSDTAGWEPAAFYWQIVNGRIRFKVMWTGNTEARLSAREGFRVALEQAAAELGEAIQRTRTRAGTYMTALELAADARDAVLIDGRVSPDLALDLYQRSTRLFSRAIQLLTPLQNDVQAPDQGGRQ